MKSKRFAGLLALLLALFLPATAFAAENDDIVAIQWKKIAGEDFYIDELDGVKAYPQYQCNDFAIRYYQEVFDVDMFVGVTPPFLLRNLFSDETGFVLTDEPKKGDIAYWPMERRGLPMPTPPLSRAMRTASSPSLSRTGTGTTPPPTSAR